MQKIDSFLKHNPKYRALSKPLEAAAVCDKAKAVAQGRFEVISFKQGLLTVGVNSPAEAMNLQAESMSIIKDINRELGREAITKLRFKIQ